MSNSVYVPAPINVNTSPRAFIEAVRELMDFVARQSNGQAIVGPTPNPIPTNVTINNEDILALRETWIPLSKFGIHANMGTDVTDLFGHALNDGPGMYYPDEPGDYQINGTIFNETSGSSLYVPSGCHIRRAPGTTVGSLIDLGGTLGVTRATVTADIVARQQGEDTTPITVQTIEVAPGHTLLADMWVSIEDNLPQSIGSAAKHRELNRIRQLVDATHVTLWYPTADDYTVLQSAVIKEVNIVTDSWVLGKGTLSNSGSANGTAGGGHGLRVGWAFNCGADGVTFAQVRDQAMKFQDARNVRATNLTLRDASVFNSRGYGITTTSVVGAVIGLCQAYRLRHCFDISFFSRSILVDSCATYGAAFTPYQTHPDVKGVAFTNFIIDGVRGYRNAEPYNMADDVQGVGFAVRENCQDIIFSNGLVRNVGLSGGQVDNDACERITIQNMRFSRINLRGVANQAAIYLSDRSNLTNICPDLLVRNIEINESFVCGVYATFDNAVIDGVRIRGMRPGTDAPDAIRSGSGSSFCVGAFIGVHTYADDPIDPDEDEEVPSFSTIETITLRNFDIESTYSTLLNHGIQIGGTEWVNTFDEDYECLIRVDLENVVVKGTGGAGVWAAPSRKVDSGFNFDVKVGRGRWKNVRVFDCNKDNLTTEAGLLAADPNGLLDTTESIELDDCLAEYCTRFGIITGMQGQVHRNVRARFTVAPGGVAGIGHWYRPFTGTPTLDDPVFLGGDYHGNGGDGLRIGHDSIGLVRGALAKNIAGINNAAYGLHIFNNCDNSISENCSLWDNADAGLRIGGDNHRSLSDSAGNRRGTAQDYGIDIGSTAVGTVIEDPHLINNTLAPLRATATTARLQWDARVDVAVADTNYTILLTDRCIRWTSLTASRTATLPSAQFIGLDLIIADASGSCSAGVTITPTPAGGDTIIGSAVLNSAFAFKHLRCVAANTWLVVASSVVAGVGSTDIVQTEIDFGATPVEDGIFVVVDGSVSGSSHLIGQVAYVAPTGKDLDEIEMDALDLKFAPGTGQFTIYARGLEGYIADKFKINYLVG